MVYISQIFSPKVDSIEVLKRPYPLRRSLTPLIIRRGESEGRIMPQSFSTTSINYPQDSETGLYTYNAYQDHKIEFAYSQDLEELENTEAGINEAKFVKLAEKEYVYKRNLVSAEHLPIGHERATFKKNFPALPDTGFLFYHSNSRVMMQIMSRDLLELFVKGRDDVILPKIYPIVDKENGEVCGMITEKIDFEEDGWLQEARIKRTIENNGIPSLMKILGIEDILRSHEVNNVGITKDNKLVFFDFGNNLIDNELLSRTSIVDLEDIHHYVSLGKSLKDTRERYLQDYNTKNDENGGLAKTIHPDIENIVMTKGPGDEESRKEMAKIIQTRINNAFILG